MQRRARASAEGRFPPSAVDGSQLTVTKASWHFGPSGREPALKAAGRAAHCGEIDQISAAAHKCC